MTLRVILLPHGFQREYECAFANGLARNGIQVTLVGSDNTLLDRLEPSVKVVNLRGSQDPGRSRWEKTSNLLLYFLRYLSFLARHRGAPVQMIGTFTSRNLWVSLVESWCTRLLTGRYVLTVHNLLPHGGHNSRSIRLMRGIYRSAAMCMVHTDRMRDELHQRFSVPLDRIVVVQHGIDRLLLPPSQTRAELRFRFGLPDRVPVVLFFGYIAPYKGMDVLLPAIDLIRKKRDLVLVVAGHCGDPTLKQWLKGELGPRVEAAVVHWFDGYLPEDDVVPMFHAADVLVLPYRHIDQSGVVFMALATGLPVVATRVGSLADYVPSPGLTVPPGAIPELAAAIDAVLAAPRPAPAVAQATAERFLWCRTVMPLLDVYRRLWPGWAV